jgi:probable LLM family oxidoreductase
MELGIYTFGETTTDPVTGAFVTPGQRLRNLIGEIAFADEVGLDVFGLGEHHRADYAISAPPVVLAAAAQATRRILLTSAVTVLSSEDPVRVYQQFATLDLISGGRAEIMAGRGSFIESFPLFGRSLDDYDDLFAENLELLLQIREQEKVTWRGGHRAAIDGHGVYPRAERPIPIWIAVGGTPQSVARAGALGLPLALAIIGGEPARFAPLVNLYREAGRRAGHEPGQLKVGINAHGFIADTSQTAVEAFWPPYRDVMSRIGRERGWPPLTRAQFEAGIGPGGHLLVGSPQQVIDKLLAFHDLFRNDRFLMQMSLGPLPQPLLMRSIELFGTVVAPALAKALGQPVASEVAAQLQG